MIAPGVLREARPDPLQETVPLPLAAVVYPLGFRCELATNSREVTDAAEEAWGAYSQEFDCKPLRIRIIVQPNGPAASEPAFRAQSPLFAVVSDAQNFAVLDSGAFCGFCHVTAATVSDHDWFRWSFLESMVYMLLSQRHIVPVHAACVERDGQGVLLSGNSGAGKSTLAFACARSGWTYVCDDATILLAGSGNRRAIGKSSQVRLREDAARFFPEIACYAAKVRPNRKLSIEVPMKAFPKIRTASTAYIRQVVFLERRAGSRPRLLPVESAAAVETLLADIPLYGPDVNDLHESTIRQLERVPAWRLCYDGLQDAVAELTNLVRQ